MSKSSTLSVDAHPPRQLAILQDENAQAACGLFWLGGFKSDMIGGKATSLSEFAVAQGLSCTRFDYSGHGQSSGEFLDGTISDWLEDACCVFEQVTKGPQILVGSSMGGWLALLLNRALRAKGDDRVQAIVLIAPAVDMTQDLMWAGFSDEQRAEMAATGQVSEPSDYGDEPYILTQKLIEDGRTHLMFDAMIETGCPVHILQGMADPDVPYDHALKLVNHLGQDEVVMTLIRDGDHRLSRDQDLAMLQTVILGLL